MNPAPAPSLETGLTLAFRDPDTEAAFRTELRQKTLSAVRLSLILGAVLYGTFGVLDFSVIPDVAALALVIRYGFVCPLILAVLLASFHDQLKRYVPTLSAIVAVAAGLGIVLMISIASPPGSYLYYAGLLLVCTAIYTFFRLRFAVALALGWGLVAVYEISAVAAGTAPTVLINNTFFLLGTNIVGMAACYSTERTLRTAFLDQRTIEALAHHDALTGLLNRRAFFPRAEAELARCVRRRAPVSALMLDVDHFKAINDRHGHIVGDEVLQAIATTLEAQVRPSDHVCRYGGEEFLALLPETTLAEASAVAERVRAAIAAIPTPVPATVSVGVGNVLVDGPNELDALILAADRALYRAKASGRNAVALAA